MLSAVFDKPLIHSSQDLQKHTNGQGRESKPETHGDVAAHGFWQWGTMAIFDIWITDPDRPSVRNQNSTKLLKQHEKWKRDKYLVDCLARRRHFTLLMFSVDGLQGAEANAAAKWVASLLSKKWHRAYSEVCGFV